ncbi:hypothetical protein LINPERHAP1_LOCUS36552 [Linum perenne]
METLGILEDVETLVSDKNQEPQGCVFVLDVVAACSNDYEDGDVDFKRGSNGLSGRKRRVVFDDSDDECEDAVNLSSGDIVNGQTNKPVAGTGEKHDTVMQDERKSDVGVGSRSVNAASSAPSKCGETKTSRAETMGSCIVQNDVKDNASSNIVPSSSKRNKVMKTWIDERGREVTEVVYEQDETEKKSTEIKKQETPLMMQLQNPQIGKWHRRSRPQLQHMEVGKQILTLILLGLKLLLDFLHPFAGFQVIIFIVSKNL